MRVQVFQHVAFEGLGAIEPWLRSRGAAIATTRFFEPGPPIPAPGDYDWLVAMGGPMSANDEASLPWLRDEKRAIAAAIDAGKTVLGICLGAQLVASALGSPVVRAREREIGWHPIMRVAEAEGHPLASALPPRADVFHWHGETFALPPGAVHLARSEGCEAQAFALGPRVLALQFHVETTPQGVDALVRHCPGDLAPGPWVQPADAMLREPARFAQAHALLDRLLDALERASPAH
ncbi:MAG: amidotransferase [Proteobacteria bacterium]|nr:MAG: amidotransferase [Pseudomonadota bacterium]